MNGLNVRGQKDSTMGRVFALSSFDQGRILGTICGLRSLTEVIPESRNRRNA